MTQKTLISFLFFLPAVVFAGAIEQFRTFTTQVKTAKGDFVQQQVKVVKNKARLYKPLSGDFVFDRTGKLKFIWKYVKPNQQTLQSDGTNLYIYDKDLKQVSVYPNKLTLDGTPASILFGNPDWEKQFTVKEIGKKKDLEWMEATPKFENSSFKKIGIGFKNGEPLAMELYNNFNQITLLTFKNIQKNPKLKADIFKFVPPKDVDVMYQ